MGNCLITRRGGSGGGGTTPSLPTGYTSIDYVNTGTGTNGQSAFELQSYIPQKADTIKIVTITPSTVDSEAAFFGTNEGSDSYELYYDTSFNIRAYGNIFRCDNFSEQIAGSLTKNTTIAYFYNSADYVPRIGCYRIERYPYAGRIYLVTAYRSKTNEMLINLVPCIRTADSTVGMFDLVNQVFYTSTIGDPFTAPA